MAVDQEHFVHLARPLAPSVLGFSASSAPLTVNIQPQAIFSIIDHAVRRDLRDTNSARVIGALVGVRSEDGSEVEVRQTFAIPHTENEDQVEVDVEYQKNMLALTLRASPRETLLGWYTTSHELNSFSALIQNFFASPDTGTFPHPAVHLTISTEAGTAIETKTYISAPVAVNAERAAESCLFIEVPRKLLFTDAERAGLGSVSAAAQNEDRSAPIASDIEGLAQALETVSDLLERVSGYVGEVLDEERDGSHALGQLLMNALSLAPKVDPSAIEHDFNNHIQDVLMVSYLANTIRTQIDLAQRLATAPLAAGEKEAGDRKEGEDGKDGKQEGGNRGGKRGGRGGRGGGRGGGDRSREPREPRETE
ncbi:maintenance of mitochondrial structure and function-domain-containing protein [Diplogelasinospora grovesii]|uniref:Eukaryotic translation initiation factor 3 subunit F n=1 Tax=Diplogelasinospora grovesii TaxID=303347 RepID=A0AAN6NHG5_9PEZI|nr:maintenance of mitochondrial structure and function-domain-containing protein [Diplogelasinospora grovesii]